MDLVTVGDLMIALNQTDVESISLVALRRASAQLVHNTRFARPVEEMPGHVGPVPLHEACSEWLAGPVADVWKSEEAASFEEAWRRLYRLYITGAHVSVLTVKNMPSEVEVLPSFFFDDPSGRRRRRRQVDDELQVDDDLKFLNFTRLQTIAMGKLNEGYTLDYLTPDQDVSFTVQWFEF